MPIDHRASPLSFVAVLIAAVLSADSAAACRCAQRPLAMYYADAEVVFIGRVISSDTTQGEPPRRSVRFAVQGKPFKGDPGAIRDFATAESSATCGYAVEPERFYLIFASRRAGEADVAWFDTCNGTRQFDPRAPGGVQGFDDVPAADVLPRLAALRDAAGNADARTSATPRLPKPGDPQAQIVGLLEIPSLFGGGEGTAASGAPPAAYDAPRTDARRIDLGAARPASREVGYEHPAAVVRQHQPGWYRIELADGRSAWVRAEECGAFRALPELLLDRLTYLGPQWDGWLWPEPGAGYAEAARRSADREQPVNIRETQLVGGSLWLRVEVLAASPCDGGTPQIAHSGWVPAYTPEGEPIAWFYSRGC